MFFSLLFLVPFLAVINAANDWSVPCITGECSYDILTTNGSSSGTLAIWGSQDAITDITHAADWEILGCDPNALSQDIRLVCKSDDPAAKCSHLYQNIGAVNKLVRLPENCGSSAFARVAKAWIPEDQSIPSSIASRLVRRDGTQPEVKALSLDTNFNAVDWSQTGVVNIAIQGANVPGASGTIPIPPSKRTTRLSQRGLFGFVKNAIKAITSNSIEVNKSLDLKPLDFNKDVNLVNEQIKCGALTASLKIDLNGQAHAAASVGVAATGTIIPPKITDFAIIAGLTANVAATLNITADVAGSVDTGKQNLVKLGIPGLDFPGILSIGPTFQVDAQVTASLDVNLDMTVGLNFDVNNAQLRFPPGSGDAPDANAFSIGDTPLTLSASPDVKATGAVSAHLIPSLNLGVSALGNVVNAQVFLALDTSASLKLSLEASADIQTVIDNSKTSTVGTDKALKTTSTGNNATSTSAKMIHTTSVATNLHTSSASKAMPTTTSKKMHKTSAKKMPTTSSNRQMMHTTTSSKPMHATSSSSSAAMSHSAAAPEPSAAHEMSGRAVTASFGGCFEVDAGVNVNVGADGSFFGLFDKSTNATLFAKNFVVFKKCFGAVAPKRSLAMLSRLDLLGRRAGLTCPASNVKPVALVDQTVQSDAIAAA
ncbi:hypothetical protein B0H17DRAFT_1191688 [Mycena rosella]|uniref:DUF7223 domain-containing protein n=1 Tax=Mycena rosella TaxID=1033263 RepID=A0AAD7GYX0_MYCRO|nr:hypothetical protein B0H17DRAFT_1191688 [Mycena rosella]